MGIKYKNLCHFSSNYFEAAARYGSPTLYQSRNCRWAKFVLTIVLELLTLDGYVMTTFDKMIKASVGEDWGSGDGVKGRQYYLAFRKMIEVFLENAGRCCDDEECKCWVGDEGEASKDPVAEITQILRDRLSEAKEQFRENPTQDTIEKIVAITAKIADIEARVSALRVYDQELAPEPILAHYFSSSDDD